MSNEDGTVWIVYNGEIYNFQDLRWELERAGHVFHSNSDTEVVLHAYEEWGDDHVQHLRGMFAYALYDRRPRGAEVGADANCSFRLLLVRDRVGIKPLFYYWHSGAFVFASEIKAILACPGVDRTIDRSAIFDYLTHLYIPTPKTAYAHVRKLPPGHWLVFEDGCVQMRQYWDVPLSQPCPTRTLDQAVEMVREALVEAVRLHMISDVPVGVFLSGGMDSSTVTALMTQVTEEPVRTYSIGFDVAAHTETQYARLVAERFKTRHRERTLGPESVRQMLEQVVWMYDEPYADGSAMPTYRVSQLAREEVKVVLAGDGGDEVFAGYGWYERWLQQQKFRDMPTFVRHGLLAPIGRAWPGGFRGGRVKRLLEDMAYAPFEQYARQMELFSPEEKRRILAPEWTSEFAGYDDYWYFRKYWHAELDPITRLQYLDLKTYLPDDILTKVDRASMAVGLEARPPLLDHRLIELVLQIPADIRFHNAEKKYLLKQAMVGVLPQETLTRGKKGFSSPLMQWMVKEAEWVDSFLRCTPRLVRPETLNRIGHYSHGAKLWALLVLEQWARGL